MFLNIWFLIIYYVLICFKCFLFVSVCAFARQFLSVRSMSFVFFSFRLNFPVRVGHFSLLYLSAEWYFLVCAFAIFSSFAFYYLFINWFCVRLVSLVLSLVWTMFYGCVDLVITCVSSCLWLSILLSFLLFFVLFTYIYMIRRKSRRVWPSACARIDNDYPVLGCRFSGLTGWRRLCVGVVVDFN